MKVNIFAEGGNKIGYGHISRCISLYEECQSRGLDVEFIVNDSIDDLNLLTGKKYVLRNWIKDSNISKLYHKDDFCIIDSYLADKELMYEITNSCKKCLFIDDYNRIKYPKGLIVNSSLNDSSITQDKMNENIILSGADFVILRSPFLSNIRKIIKKQVGRVLITLGGGNVKSLYDYILDNICRKHINISFFIVISNSSFNLQYYSENNIEILQNISSERMKELMQFSDIAITAAGQTVYELIITKTPFIAIQTVENQENNLINLRNKCPKNYFLKINEQDLYNNILSSFHNLLIQNERREFNSYFLNIIDNKGSKRIIEYFLKDEV